MIGLAFLLCSTAASAVPIDMSPNPVLLPSADGTPDSFTLTLLSGDTATNRLNFQLDGPGGGWFLPTVGSSVIVFDDVILTDMGSTSAVDMLFLGPASLEPGASNHAAW